MRIVKGEGPKNARIIVIGEAPGKAEEALGRPFVGASGNLLRSWLNAVGVDLMNVRLDNFAQIRPPRGNDIETFPVIDLVDWAQDLEKRIAELNDPYILVPTGNYPTFVLTGKGKVKAAFRKECLGDNISASEAESKAGITKLRGSIYLYKDLKGRFIKVIPTIHPSWFIRGQMKKQGRALADWEKIKREAEFKDLERKARTHIINPSEEDVKYFCSVNKDALLAIDIETRGKMLTCVGFAKSDRYSITIPLIEKMQVALLLPYIKQLCESDAEKVMHNGLYDAYWLAFWGIKVRNWKWDTMAMHHALDPTDQHSLDYLSSIYLPDHQYWKDEAKDKEEVGKYAKDLDALWTYNGIDCCVTHELFFTLHELLKVNGLMKFYQKHYMEMFGSLLGAMLHGVRVNVDKQQAWKKQLKAECEGIRGMLAELAGEDLYAAKDFSPKKLRDFFYEKLGIPKQYKTVMSRFGKTKIVSLNETALRKIILKYPSGVEEAKAVLLHRQKARMASLMNKAWDTDERVRCSYKFTTESGQLESAKNPRRNGMNLQNIDKEIRKTFLPDEGYVFLKFTLSQPENRIVMMWTREDKTIEQANERVFDLSEFGEAKDIYCSEIRKRVRQDRMLVNNWGRVWYCRYDYLDKELYEKAYTFNPQSDAADLLNQWGIKTAYYEFGYVSNLIMADEHSFIINCEPEKVWDIVNAIVKSLERPRYYFKNALVVPVEITVGKNWADSRYEFKRIPERKMLEEVSRETLKELEDEYSAIA